MVNFKKIRDRIFSKTFVGAFLFAVALWTYATLSGEFVTYVDIPLNIKLPEDRAIENELPDNISVEVRGTGWNLFTVMFFTTSALCNIDLSRENITDSVYTISRNEIIKNVILFDLEAIDVLPETMNVKLGKIGTRMAYVEPVVDIDTRERFVLVREPRAAPDSIRIRGNEKVINKIDTIRTKYLKITDAYRPISEQVELSDSMKSIIELSRNYVNVKADIQQARELTYDDIKIIVKGGSLPKNSRLKPEYLSVTVRGGIDQLAEFTPETITASIDYKQILMDSTGIIIPDVKAPAGVELLNVKPRYIYHYKVVNMSRLAGY